jgi:serine/threonine protein kinase
MSSSFIGKVVDNYRIIENLGIGGMGVVFKAIHIKLDKLFALKMIAPGLAMNENFIKRFQTEAKALAKFEDPNIVRIYDLRADNDQWFIVMEYVDGFNLLDLIRKDGAFPLQNALPILKQILTAIGHAHRAGIIHRDLKPNNVMITTAGKIKITDFGLAKDQTSMTTTLSVTSGGTLYYMSPEQVKGFQFTDKRSDIYSIGMTFYEMITGTVPFKNMDSDFDIRESIIRKKTEKPTVFNPKIPPELEAIVMKSIAKKPDDRYQSTEEMLKAVLKFEAQDPNIDSEFALVEIPDSGKQNLSKKESEKLLDRANLHFLKNLFSLNRKSLFKIGVLGGLIAATLLLFYIFYSDSSLSEKEDDAIAEASQFSSEPAEINKALIKPEIKSTPKTKIPENTALPAQVTVNSDPSDAEIRINGQLKGKTPLNITDMAPGNYNVHIKKDGFEKYNDKIKLTSGQNDVFLAELSPLTGGINLTTEPPSARILLDGKEVSKSKTPVKLDKIPIGKHKIEIQKKGYASVTKEIEIKRDEITETNIQLVQLDGKLSIQVRPWGSIYINDNLKKESADIKYEVTLPVEQYKVTVTHPTLGKWERMVEIEADEERQLVVNFNRKITVNVAAFDENGLPLTAEIFIDNENTGKFTPAEIKTRVGLHKLTIKMDGYIASNGEKEIFFDKNTENKHTVILKKID